MDNLFLTDLNERQRYSRSERVRQERLLDNSFDRGVKRFEMKNIELMMFADMRHRSA